MISMSEDVKTLGFDYTHNNKLVIESSSYSDFVAYLFGSSYRVGQIKQGITKEKLSKFDAFIVGNPYGRYFELEEIEALEDYVKQGGGLLLISDDGGDYENETNLCELSEKFGFKFNPDKLSDSVHYLKQQDKILIKNFEPHYVTKEVEQFVHSSGCSLDIDESMEVDDRIDIHVLAKSGINAYATTFTGEGYEEVDAPRRPILVAINYYDGRVIGLGNVSIFSSLSSFYGFNALDNNILIANILNWLTLAGAGLNGDGVLSKLLSVPINQSLYLWLEKMVQTSEWERVSDMINFSVKYFKDNYQKILKETADKREELKKLREKRKKEEAERAEERDKEREEALKSAEDDLYGLVGDSDSDERSEKETETFKDLMSDLSKLTDDD